ncbi:PREDICTED: coiled-coil domain-containing protein 152 isoform X2 [Poecilia mexicana]|uniref:coiled-coil domain-containing protein 152 isoform X2 n=1 Tax=Poecilia mexicana TaxID=48701 RepID=UPI00072DC0F1|nr:PREDICTED: coiled-coil domain-containing protein 152 isoform X2 [Poecilia mexicana]
MAKLNCVKLEGFMVEFGRLEQNITELNGARNLLEIRLEDSNRLVNFYVNKEQSLRDVENKKLRMEVEDLKEENERTAEAGRSDVQLLLSQMAAAEDRHQRALEAVKQQSSREVEEAQIQAQRQMEAKDAEVQQQLEEMKTRMKEQERERQSEMLKLQMEFGAKLARVQSSAQRNQQQLHGSNLLPQSVFKRKLQFFQEEKNKEIAALRQRIKELEESQGAVSSSSSYTKRRKF